MSEHTRHVLVVAAVTDRPEALRETLLARAARGPAEFTLLLAADDGPPARDWLLRTVELLRAGGLAVDGRLGAGDVNAALAEAWDPREHDELLAPTGA